MGLLSNPTSSTLNEYALLIRRIRCTPIKMLFESFKFPNEAFLRNITPVIDAHGFIKLKKIEVDLGILECTDQIIRVSYNTYLRR